MDAWKIKEQKDIERNEWIALRKDTCITSSGKTIPDYYVLELQDVSCVIGLTTDQQVLLIEEYKHGVQKSIVQLPCGYVEKGEKPQAAAQREFLEETGYESEKWFCLGSFGGSPGRLTHYYHFFLALDCRRTHKPQLDELESLRSFLCAFDAALADIPKESTDIVTPLGLFLAKEFLKRKEIKEQDF